MLKGCSKRMLVLKGASGDFFEEAYFVLRAAADHIGIADEKHFISEARKLVSKENREVKERSKKNSSGTRLLLFAMGFLTGTAVSAIITLAAASL